MAKSKFNPRNLFIQIAFFVFGALLTGFLSVFFARFLGHYIPQHFAYSVAVGLGVGLTIWATQLVRKPVFLFKGVSPLVIGFCAALGVHISRTWLT